MKPETEITSEEKPVTISDFVKANDGLLQVLGVFAGLVLFSAVIEQDLLSATLGFLFVGITILISREVTSRIPENRTFSLSLFSLLLTWSLYCLILYWLVGYVDLWEAGAMTYVLLIVCGIAFMILFTRLIGVLGFEGFVFHREKLKRRRQEVAYYVLFLIALCVLVFILLQIPRVTPFGVALIRELRDIVQILPTSQP